MELTFVSNALNGPVRELLSDGAAIPIDGGGTDAGSCACMFMFIDEGAGPLIRLEAAFFGVLGVGGGTSSDCSISALGVAPVVVEAFLAGFCSVLAG